MEKRSDNDFPNFLKQLGQNLRKERNKKEISQEKLAEINNIDYKYYQRIETGRVNITIKTLYKLSKSLNIKPYKLLDKES